MAFSRYQRIPMVFEPDLRPDADSFVYCKGCGHPLSGEPRRQQPRVPVAVMMCEPCRQRHGHALIPRPGAPSFCYRCGAQDEIFIEGGMAPVTHHVCPRCVPERAARYRGGNFKRLDPPAQA
jgi:hypothetical protein